jgi:SSS family solute:Na+ symporter
MPLYAIAMPLMFLVGFGAVLILPGLKNGDLSVLTIVRKTFPAWFLGIVGGAGALTAMVPAAIQLLAGATLYAKNLYRPLLAPEATDQQVARVAKILVLILTLGALFFAIHSSASLVSLLLLGVAGVAQLFPGVLLGLFSTRVTTSGVFAGIAAGLSIAAFLMLTGRDPYMGLNAAFIALCFNFAVTGIVSLLTPVRVAGFDEPVPTLAASQCGNGR